MEVSKISLGLEITAKNNLSDTHGGVKLVLER